MSSEILNVPSSTQVDALKLLNLAFKFFWWHFLLSRLLLPVLGKCWKGVWLCPVIVWPPFSQNSSSLYKNYECCKGKFKIIKLLTFIKNIAVTAILYYTIIISDFFFLKLNNKIKQIVFLKFRITSHILFFLINCTFLQVLIST